MSKVYDCFMYCGEADVLEIRLNELDAVVDHFVICESTRTFTNQPKPLYFLEQQQRFSRFLPKITHIVVDDFPTQPSSPWELEHFQRNALARGLVTCAADDIVIISDADEIPSADAVRRFEGPISGLRMRLFYYYLNLQNVTGQESNKVWSVMCRYEYLRSPQWLRDFGHVDTYQNKIMDNAGWHFSYLGDAEWISRKLSSFSHQEPEVQRANNVELIRQKIEAGEDLFGRDYRWEFVPVDASYPAFLKANKKAYKQFIGSGRQGSREPAAAASSSYYEHNRPEVVAMVPLDARRILELGCASGGLGALLKQRQDCDVTGIEYSAEAGERARGRLDRVIIGDAESLDLEGLFQKGEFDCLIAADVLEHLRDPEALLRRLQPYLTPEARIVVSLPNIRHAGVLKAAVEGYWTYQDAGILDRTHLRFFTRREIDSMFARLGFEVEERRSVDEPVLAEWERMGRPTSVSFGPLQLNGLTQDEIREFFVVQWLVRSRSAVQRQSSHRGEAAPLVSIVILTWNQLEYTRQCVESVLRHTRAPFELIFVDNGSTDGTPDYLRTIPGAKVVLNAENLGFAGGNNQGLALASGEYVVLLNNDAIVTEGWLEHMIAPMQRDASIGFVGPRSNYVAGPQLVADVPYNALSDMEAFAAQRRRSFAGRGSETAFIVGFCLMLRRQIVQTIGGLDTCFGSGNFEDNDYCLRAVMAGWKGWIADDVFVHHYGHRTFIGNDVDWQGSMYRNAGLFVDKWGLTRDKDTGAPVYPGDFLQTRRFTRSRDIFPLPTSVAYTEITPALAAYHTGVQALAAGDALAAISALQASVADAPDIADFHNALGAALFEEGHRDEAIAAFARASELAPENTDIQLNLADALQASQSEARRAA